MSKNVLSANQLEPSHNHKYVFLVEDLQSIHPEIANTSFVFFQPIVL